MKISLSSVALIISLNRSDRRRRRDARMIFAALATRCADQVYQNKSLANPTRPSRRCPSLPSPVSYQGTSIFLSGSFTSPSLKKWFKRPGYISSIMHSKRSILLSRIRRAYLLRKVRPSKLYRVSRFGFVSCRSWIFFSWARGCPRRKKKLDKKPYKC